MNAGDFFFINAGNAYLNLSGPVVPAALFMAAFDVASGTTQPIDADEIADPSSNAIGYARAPVVVASFVDLGTGVFELAADLDFAVATGAWTNVQAVAIVTDATAAVLTRTVVYGQLTEAPTGVPIITGDTLRIKSGTDFQITIS